MHDVPLSTGLREAEPFGGSDTFSKPWTSDALHRLAEGAIAPGEICVEIDRFLSGLCPAGREEVSPYDVRSFIPVGYVQQVMKDGLAFEGRFAAQLAGNALVGTVDGDLEPRFGVCDARFASPAQVLRVRTLDTHLDGLPRMALLVLGEHAAKPDIIRSGRIAIGTHRPIIALSPATSEELSENLAALREIDDTYRWILLEVPRSEDGEGESEAGSIWVAAPQPHDRKVESVVAEIAGRRALFGSRPQRTALRSAAFINSPAALRGRQGIVIRPDQFVATAGFHSVEQEGHNIWRWGGALPHLSMFTEVETPGLYEISIVLANALQGAVESIRGIRVNGALIPDLKRAKGDRSFAVQAPLHRHVLLEINCGVRTRIDVDQRILNVALAEVRIRPLTIPRQVMWNSQRRSRAEALVDLG